MVGDDGRQAEAILTREKPFDTCIVEIWNVSIPPLFMYLVDEKVLN